MNITHDKFKVFLLFSVFALAIVVSQHLLNNLIFNDAPKNMALNNGVDKTLERQRLFQFFLENTQTQITSIRQSQAFQYFLTHLNSHETEEVFAFVVKNNPYIMQARFLDKTGQEVLRIERSDYQSEPKRIPQSTLPNNATEDYFQKALQQKSEQVFFSKLDLNLKSKPTEMAFKAALSAYLPIFESQQFQGVLVINYFMEPFLKRLVDAPLYDFILADTQGNALYHDNNENRWLAYQGIPKTLSDHITGSKPALNSTVFLDDDYIARKLNLSLKNQLYLILKLKQPYLEALAREAKRQTLIVALITLFFALLASSIMAKQLDKLWQHLNTARQLEKQFRSTFEQAASGMAHIDTNGHWIRTNQTLTKMLGYNATELATQTLNKLRHPDDINPTQQLKRQLLNNEIAHYQIENRLRHQNGHYIWVSITTSLVRDEHQNPEYFILVIQDISQEKHLYEELNLANKTLKIAQKTAHLGFWELEHNTQKLSWNTQTYQIFGLEPQTIEPSFKTLLNFIPQEEQTGLVKAFEYSIKHKEDYSFSHSIITPSNQKRYVQERGHHIFDDHEQPIKTIGTVQDQTEQVKAYQRIQKIFDLQNQLLFLTDGHSITLANKALLSFFGQNTLSEFMQSEQNLLQHLMPMQAEASSNGLTKWITTQAQTDNLPRPVALQNKQGELQTFNLSVHEFDEHQWLFTLSDISKTIQEKAILEAKVNQDALTKAFNRHFFEHHIDELIEQAQTNRKRLGIIYFDIDHFKQINDTYGHDIGDAVLKAVVKICQTNLRENDYLVRWGGEEFVILIQVDSEQVLQQVCENLRHKIANFSFDQIKQVTASFGIALHESEEPIKQTLRRADGALYQAKNDGRNQVALARRP